ncbi:MAG: HK97-gp10 family putative phage morphogenesis protein [Acidimicrobiales bacterium]
MVVTADVSQVNRLAGQLGKAGTMVHKPVNIEMREAAKRIRARGRVNIRKRSGQTARSISYRSQKKGLRYVIGPRKPRAHIGRFLEHGTRKMPAYPFMEPALQGEPTRLPDALAKRVADSIVGILFTPLR